MITFATALLILILGYIIYGRYIERLMAPDKSAKTPAIEINDGVDYVPMSQWRIFMIQFLNIAGLGPIFGAIMGAKFGAASYIWIVLGTIFAGAMHDYTAGMISLRNGGESLPESVGRYLGTKTRSVMRLFTIALMLLVAAVFVSAPAGLITSISVGWGEIFTMQFWIVVIFIYYVIATLLPIDKLIAKLYPIFAIALIFMAAGVLISLMFDGAELPEIWTTGALESHVEGLPIFPMMFISIACGAISGFHASQSPMMARCMTNQSQARPIFYGAMVVEGIVALIWAAAATHFFAENTFQESNAAVIVSQITTSRLGTAGALLAMLGVFFAPITSGDTALRSARLIVADTFKMGQSTVRQRMMLSLPLFAATMAILLYSIQDSEGFNIIWRYFAWCNQLLSIFTLLMVSVYLAQQRKNYLVALIPLLFMVAVTSCYILIAPEGFRLERTIAYMITAVITAVAAAVTLRALYKFWGRSSGSTPSLSQ